MDSAVINKLVETYEYKSPSYDLVERQPRPGFACDSPRFARGEDGVWRSTRASEADSVSILIAGDLLCQEDMILAYRKKDGSGYDFNPCFDYIRPLLHSADLVIGNLETVVSETAPYRGEIYTHEGPLFSNAPIEYLAALRNAGFDVLTMSNNHILDAGLRGLVETADNCERFGLIHTGVVPGEGRRCEVIEIHSIRIGLAGFATTYNTMEWNLTRQGRLKFLNTYFDKRAKTLYDTLRQKGADYTIALPHWGREYTEEIVFKQRRMADAFVDLGFDLIAGSHPRVVQKFSRTAGVPVLFSLGSLVSHINNALPNTRNERYPLLCHVVLRRGEDGRVQARIRFIPCCIEKQLGGASCVVVPCGMEGSVSEEVARRLACARERVAQRLGVGAELVELAHGFEGAVTISPVVQQLEGLDALCEARSEDAEGSEAEAAQQSAATESTDDGACLLVQSGCVIRLYDDHAEQVDVTEHHRVVRCPKEVEGVAITKVALAGSTGEGVRLMCLSSRAVSIEAQSCVAYPHLESVCLFKGLKRIEKGAFASCPKLTGVVLPVSLESIGEGCFAHCRELRSVKVPPSVHSIGSGAFEDCPKLVIYCEEGSFAQHFAQENGIPYRCMPLTNVARSGAGRTEQVNKKAAAIARGVRRLAPKTKPPVTGAMNKPDDLPPVTILAACELLGAALPSDARCGAQPSSYLGASRFAGTLRELKDILGDRFPSLPDGDIEQNYQLFRNKFASQQCLYYTDTDLTVYFTDWLLFAREFGFTHDCYFDFELYNKEPEVRSTFLNEGYRQRVYEACAGKRASRQTLLNKGLFNKTFSDYVRRDWIDASTCTFEEFAAFVSRHESFFGKPIKGTGGVGSHVVRRDVCPLEDLYASCKDSELICEEIVRQHPALARVNASTLNTVRVVTMLDVNDEPHVLFATARFGRAGKSVDNFHGGGVAAVLDVDTGTIVSQAINRAHIRHSFHPDSGVQLLGFSYPHWDKIKKAVCEGARRLPDMRNIGWDVAVTEKDEVEFVEGNGRPNYDVIQSPDQLGKKDRCDAYLRAIEQLKGIERVEPPLMTISLHNTYAAQKRRWPGLSRRLAKIKRLARRLMR